MTWNGFGMPMLSNTLTMGRVDAGSGVNYPERHTQGTSEQSRRALFAPLWAAYIAFSAVVYFVVSYLFSRHHNAFSADAPVRRRII